MIGDPQATQPAIAIGDRAGTRSPPPAARRPTPPMTRVPRRPIRSPAGMNRETLRSTCSGAGERRYGFFSQTEIAGFILRLRINVDVCFFSSAASLPASSRCLSRRRVKARLAQRRATTEATGASSLALVGRLRGQGLLELRGPGRRALGLQQQLASARPIPAGYRDASGPIRAA